MDAREARRRASRTDALDAHFRAQPLVWLPAAELARVAGFCAWRTRVADVRRRLKDAAQGTIEWNGLVRESAYRFVPWVPLGRDGETRTPQRTLFELKG